MKYKTRSIIIDALQWDGTWEDVPRIQEFCPLVCEAHDVDFKRTYLTIHTNEGVKIVPPRGYIVKGLNGQFHPCKRDVFEATYEPMNDRKLVTVSMVGKLKEDWLDIWGEVVGQDPIHEINVSPSFCQLVNKIARNNGVIEINIKSYLRRGGSKGDFFEIEDDNYWFPSECFEILPEVKEQANE